MKNLLSVKKNLLFVLMSVLTLSLMVACGKDDPGSSTGGDPSTWTYGVTMENGNVVQTYKTGSGITQISTKTVYVYKNGNFDHQESQIYYSSNSIAAQAYNATKGEMNNVPGVKSYTQSGKVITIVYDQSYTTGFEGMTAQELYDQLKAMEGYY